MDRIVYDKATTEALWRSWLTVDGLESISALHEWIVDRNAMTPVSIERVSLDECHPWRYDNSRGWIATETGSFFQIAGLRKMGTDIHTGRACRLLEQPTIIQDEIGYLGIICKNIDGVVHFLMQAKTEPGNINKVQISPTVQATRSNFMQLHGGKRPDYLEYFLESHKHRLLVDQIQSEQSSRFVGKRNRNVVVLVEEDVDVLPSHMWMTLGQIKRLMDYDNLVNMDTRTVLSCLPWSFWGGPSKSDATRFAVDEGVLASISAPINMRAINRAYWAVNNYKMFDSSRLETVPLAELSDWEMRADELCHKVSYPFRVIYCDITIAGREVKHWHQPLFEATGVAFFGLLSRTTDGKREFLVRLKPEIGCFDRVELGPTVQREADSLEEPDWVDEIFLDKLENGDGVMRDVLLSEEGGRFYCEQNRNVVIFDDTELAELSDDLLPENFLWLDYATLNFLGRANNVLNIQLRNLLSLIDINATSE